MRAAYLGVDIGTSSSKGVLVSTDGEVLGTAVRQHAVDRPAPGHVEMDAGIWWEEFCQIASELTTAAETEVLAVGVSGMGPCVLLVDAEDRPVRPAILYGVDTRAQKEIDELHALWGRETIMHRSGSALTSQAVGPKLRWVRDHEPQAWARARRFFMPSSWLAYRLTGNYVLDRHSASQCTPMLDRDTQAWHEEWAPHLGEHLELPPLRWPGELAGRTVREVAGIPAGTPVVCGTIDAWTEALSVGAQRPGDLMLMYGTTMFLVATGSDPVTSAAMWGTTGALPGTYNLAGGMSTSGALTSWLRELTGGVAFEVLLEEAARSPHGANGLLVLPYFAGERTPIHDPQARGVIAGLTLSHTRGDLYRSLLEATAFGVRHNVEAMREAGVPIERVVAVGGGTQGGLWTQIVSDVTGLEQVVRRTSIGASYGAAWLASGALGQDADIERWNPIATTVRPNPATAAVYDRLYEAYLQLYPATRDITHHLADLQRASASSTPQPDHEEIS